MKEQTCCFTGHRAIPEGERAGIEKRLTEELVRLIQQGVLYFGAGGALGFDTMAALAVLRLKPLHPQIKLILVLPCEEQARSWSAADRAVYDRIKAQADKTVYTSAHYDSGCMQKRNRHLTAHSGYCVCYLTQSAGGTAYTVAQATRENLRIINVAQSPASEPTRRRGGSGYA